jgi:hypothetical protein
MKIHYFVLLVFKPFGFKYCLSLPWRLEEIWTPLLLIDLIVIMELIVILWLIITIIEKITIMYFLNQNSDCLFIYIFIRNLILMFLVSLTPFYQVLNLLCIILLIAWILICFLALALHRSCLFVGIGLSL